MILCFNRQEVETFKEKHKIIDVPFSSLIFLLTWNCNQANMYDLGNCRDHTFLMTKKPVNK